MFGRFQPNKKQSSRMPLKKLNLFSTGGVKKILIQILCKLLPYIFHLRIKCYSNILNTYLMPINHTQEIII